MKDSHRSGHANGMKLSLSIRYSSHLIKNSSKLIVIVVESKKVTKLTGCVKCLELTKSINSCLLISSGHEMYISSNVFNNKEQLISQLNHLEKALLVSVV